MEQKNYCRTIAEKTGEHCPNETIFQIEEDLFLCEPCFRNYAKKQFPQIDHSLNLDRLVTEYRKLEWQGGKI